MGKRIYLDNNATAPIRPEVIDIMTKTMAETGNASSIHNNGRIARRDIEHAREHVARLAGVSAKQVIFTSGATESNNMILKAYADQKILISAIEHPSIVDAHKNATHIPVDNNGIIDMPAYEGLLQSKPALVSIMYVNNETGVIQPLSELTNMAKQAGAVMHSDAVQAAGRISIEFEELGLDYMSLCAHKFGGPQGIGALIIKNGLQPLALLHGGGQERRTRAGTENVAAIVGFGEAARIACDSITEFQKLEHLQNYLETGIQTTTPHAKIYSQDAPRVCNTTCVGLANVRAETLLMNLDLSGICVSSGSA